MTEYLAERGRKERSVTAFIPFPFTVMIKISGVIKALSEGMLKQIPAFFELQALFLITL